MEGPLERDPGSVKGAKDADQIRKLAPDPALAPAPPTLDDPDRDDVSGPGEQGDEQGRAGDHQAKAGTGDQSQACARQTKRLEVVAGEPCGVQSGLLQERVVGSCLAR